MYLTIDNETLQTALLALLVLIQLRRAIGDTGGATWQRRLRPLREVARRVRARLQPKRDKQECDTCRH